jgi:hypothetical protein
MTTSSRFAAATLLAAALWIPAPAAAQTATSSSPAQAPAEVSDRDAEETRDALMEVLKHYPPSLAYVIKLDQGLLSNQAYLAPYPLLAQFLAKHPEVVRSPAYYFSQYTVRDSYSGYVQSPQEAAISMWRSNIEGFTFLLGFLSVVGALAWIIKSIVDHRRWNRQSRVQAEVHNKVIDRLASNEEMLAYIQSPAGAGFLKSGPAGPNATGGGRSMHAPYNRILWSAQAGVVFLALGIGFRLINVTAPTDVVEMLHFFGLIGMSLGLGFLASAGLAYVLSWRMGLLAPTGGAAERIPPSHS